ncbi:hypothetical protein ACN6Q6_16655 [Acinetobacter baumannii]
MSTTAATAITQIATTIVMPNAFQAANPPIVVDTCLLYTSDAADD